MWEDLANILVYELSVSCCRGKETKKKRKRRGREGRRLNVAVRPFTATERNKHEETDCVFAASAEATKRKKKMCRSVFTAASVSALCS